MTIEDLKAYGADTENGLKRCMNMEAFYLRLVGMVPPDANFARLFSALDAGNLDAAFEAAHALKGSTGNLSLTPLFEPLSEITELLRARKEMDYTPLADQIKTALADLTKICNG